MSDDIIQRQMAIIQAQEIEIKSLKRDLDNTYERFKAQYDYLMFQFKEKSREVFVLEQENKSILHRAVKLAELNKKFKRRPLFILDLARWKRGRK